MKLRRWRRRIRFLHCILPAQPWRRKSRLTARRAKLFRRSHRVARQVSWGVAAQARAPAGYLPITFRIANSTFNNSQCRFDGHGLLACPTPSWRSRSIAPALPPCAPVARTPSRSCVDCRRRRCIDDRRGQLAWRCAHVDCAAALVAPRRSCVLLRPSMAQARSRRCSCSAAARVAQPSAPTTAGQLA